MAVCTYCERRVKARGLCARHYALALRTGVSGDFPLERRPLAGRPCSVPDCGKPSKSRLYCSMHAERARRSGDPGGAAPSRAPDHQLCTVADCGRTARVRGYCEMHAGRIARTGEPGPADPVIARPGAGHVDKNGYRSFRVGAVRVFEHRIVWQDAHGPIPPGYCIHHKNGDRLDNRLENLALLTNAEHTRQHRALDAWRAARQKE